MREILVDNERDKFIHNIALRSAINAAIQTRSHNHPVFSKLVSSNQTDTKEERIEKYNRKLQVISFWKNRLQEQGKAYCVKHKGVNDFILDVLALQNGINEKYRAFFTEDTIRIAQCQKSLAVYLKWLWCWGKCPYEPPVCPIDRQVLSYCNRKELRLGSDKDNHWRRLIARVNQEGGWGKINNLDDYTDLVEMTITVAGRYGEHVALWELRVFNDVVLDDDSVIL